MGTADPAFPATCNARCRRLCHSLPVPLRCLIVDDNALFLEAARVLLERGGVTVAGIASSGAEASERVRALRPDVVLVDIVLGKESGFDVVRRLAAETNGDGIAVILISTHAEADFADLIAESPAAGFVPKSELSADAIRGVLDRRSR
jgi:DNA-binding NarL/FixJ family response regulator